MPTKTPAKKAKKVAAKKPPEPAPLTPAELEVQHMKTEIRTALLELRAPNRNVSGRTAWNRLAALVE